MKQTKKEQTYFSVFIMLVAFVLMIFVFFSLIETTNNNKYCENIMPSLTKEKSILGYTDIYSSTDGIEKGYIKCCRTKYNEYHEIYSNCNIVPYIKR